MLPELHFLQRISSEASGLEGMNTLVIRFFIVKRLFTPLAQNAFLTCQDLKRSLLGIVCNRDVIIRWECDERLLGLFRTEASDDIEVTYSEVLED